MKLMSKSILLIIGFLFLTQLVFGVENSAVAYEIKGKKNSVYLLGSIHIGHHDFYPFSDEIEEAFKKSKYLVVEVNIKSEENMIQAGKILEYATLDNDLTLEQVLSEEVYSKLVEILKEYDLSIEHYKSYKPWLMTILLPTLQFTKMGFSEDNGVDLYFMNKAGAGKEILELESFIEQIEMLESLNDVRYLEYSIRSMADAEVQTRILIDAWQNGNEEILEALIFDGNDDQDFDTTEINNILFRDRNIKMVKKISQYLKDDEDYFIVVGAGHLVGEEGIISILKDDGYKAVRF